MRIQRQFKKTKKDLLQQPETAGASRDHPHKSIVKIGQNTEKSSRDLRKLVNTQTPENYHLVDFAVLVNNWMKIKENEKWINYIDLTRESKKQWNTNLTMIQIVVGALGTTRKSLRKRQEGSEIREKIETIQTYSIKSG